jgi:monoamine oxidase
MRTELSGAKRRALRQITYDSGTKVLALTRRRFWELDDGIFGGGTYTDLPIGMSYYPSDNAVGTTVVSRVDAVFYSLPIPGANPQACGAIDNTAFGSRDP